jgi:TrkA domain protein
MSREIQETELPGIGRRFDLAGIDGTVSVVIHHSGRRDVYVREARPREEPTTLALTDHQARQLGAILGGAYFKPAAVEEMEAVIGDLLIDWVTLRDDSPGAGKSIRALEIRGRTRMTVAAISRTSETIIAPEPDVVLQPGDRLVVIGRPEDLPGFVRDIVGSG